MINDWDPYNLIQEGAPDDEYESEVAKILAGLPKCNSTKETAELISTVLTESFDSDTFPVAKCKRVSEKIYARFKN